MNDQRKESLDSIISGKQIRTVFQPIVSITDGNILGYEALSRIKSETVFENIEELFAAAKKYNRLWELELLCRTTALEAAHKFVAPPYNKKLFLNVNPNIMHDEKFIKGFTKEVLKKYNIGSQNIIFEITERNVVEDMESFRSTLSYYKSQDYEIAVDDAGSGYSGLNLISDVNPDYIKLDMQLIRQIHISSLKHALVKGMVEFSKASAIKLIAEGIETYEELEALVNLGVQCGQGYYLQKPDTEINGIQPEALQAIKQLNGKMQLTLQEVFSNTSIQYICKDTGRVSPEETVLKVYENIKDRAGNPGLCVIKNEIPVGIITKEKLALHLSGRYGFTLYQNKPISTIMDKNFLSVDYKTAINTVSSMAMNRPDDKLYDFIVVTEGEKYLGTLTVKDLLQKSIEIQVSAAKHLNPLSGLPGNVLIEEKLKHYIAGDCRYSVAYVDIDNFKPYNDIYGFENGDLVIMLLVDIMKKHIPGHQFIGHVGGDDFVVILEEYIDENYFSGIIKEFEERVLTLYNKADIRKGYIAALNRHGAQEEFPLVTLTAVVINNHLRNYKSTIEIAAILSGLKLKAKVNRAAIRPVDNCSSICFNEIRASL